MEKIDGNKRILPETESKAAETEAETTYLIKDFDCRQIFTCGQCFRWKPWGEWWKGVAFGRQLKIRSDIERSEVTVKGDGADKFLELWGDYFDLSTDYSKIKTELAGYDKYLSAATEFGAGIRLLKQDPFEALISFIISANNNIPRISKCIDALCARYGRRIGTDPDTGEAVYAFPEPETLAAASPEEISDVCHAGYRSPYIAAAAKKYVESGGDLRDPESYPGAGPKVAACIKLFTGADMNAFPVDVWVKRLVTELYFEDRQGGEEPSIAEIRRFIADHFPEYGGYAQQYLFYWRRENGRNI